MRENFPNNFTKSSPELTETPEFEVSYDNVRQRNNDWLRKWIKINIITQAVVFAAGRLGSDSERHFETKPASRSVPAGEIELPEKELASLDPEATPENIKAILQTLPRGFVENEIKSITFTPEVAKIKLSKDKTEIEAAHAAEGDNKEPTLIVFSGGSIDNNSYQLWGDTLLHEIAHANDWERDGKMSDPDRAELRNRVRERVQAGDRFYSSYVESIEEEDPEEHLERRAVEYWAEITKAYLSGEELPTEDESLVADQIDKTDPTFNRKKALDQRREIISQMMLTELLKGIEKFEFIKKNEREKFVNYIRKHHDRPEIISDTSKQRQGRKELTELMRAWPKTKAEQNYANSLLLYYQVREDVSRFITAGYGHDAAIELQRLKPAITLQNDYKQKLKKNDPREFSAEMERIFETYDLKIGSFGNPIDLEPGEFMELGLENKDMSWFTLGTVHWYEPLLDPDYPNTNWKDYLLNEGINYDE